MRKAAVNDPVFERLITGHDEITHNILFRIRESACADVWTDDDACVMAQSSPGTHVWVALRRAPDDALCEEIAEHAVHALTVNPDVGMTINETLGEGVLTRVERTLSRVRRTAMPMVAYGCFQTSDVPVSGAADIPGEGDRAAMASLVGQLSLECEGTVLTAEQADDFARAHVGSDRLLLWRDGGRVVAMARLAHQTERYARIATVVTDRAFRNRGYAGMVVKAFSDRLLARGITPMLYADARNPASNRAYQRIGFVETGRVTNFAFVARDV